MTRKRIDILSRLIWLICGKDKCVNMKREYDFRNGAQRDESLIVFFLKGQCTYRNSRLHALKIETQKSTISDYF